ncbi:hypothetical protein DEO72_LG11g1307 [Vigna unguiculata]|uniref:Uncharacterized protein n=1 Tax=Vigna unguiculata TaxID=3917 RepID=A0A4D6NLY4_VIGUN|nr:hypothetical protein DEO72_LG11g1307 [Vigna unguiculata]
MASCFAGDLGLVLSDLVSLRRGTTRLSEVARKLERFGVRYLAQARSLGEFALLGRALNNHNYTLSRLGEIPSPGRVAPSLKATTSPRLDEEPLNHVLSHRDLAQANVSRLSETESLKIPILLAWARYRTQKRSSFLATSLRRVVPRLSETKSLNTKPRSPGRATRPKPDVRFCNSRLDEVDSLERDLQSPLTVTHAFYPKPGYSMPKIVPQTSQSIPS